MEPERPDKTETKQLTEGEKKDIGLVGKVREDARAISKQAAEELKGLKDPQQTQLWKSLLRVSPDRSAPRNRSLAILSNVFLHLPPAKVNRDATRYNFSWGM